MKKAFIKLISVSLSLVMAFSCIVPSVSVLASDLTQYQSNMTDTQQQILSQAIDKWNDIFIKSNDSIANQADKNRKEYLIVKTIYDFVVNNTVYDTDAYKEYFESEDGMNDPYVHTAYAAFFGYRNKDITSFDSLDYNWGATLSNSIYTIDNMNQGMAVCDGYAGLFAMLCKSNGIDSIIVEGTKKTYVDSIQSMVSDNHAWNYVKLCDNKNGQYKWYQVDATYAATSGIKDKYYINYYYFLRGSANEYFTEKRDHQNVYDNKDYPTGATDLSALDYNFADTGVSLSDYNDTEDKYIAVVLKSVTGDTSYKNTLLVKITNGAAEYYSYDCDEYGLPKYNEDGTRKLIPSDGLEYKGSDKSVYMLIPGYIYGGEYTVGDASVEPGTHTVTAVGANGISISRSYIIKRINMTNVTNHVQLKGVDENNSVVYSGNAIGISAEVHDGFGSTLTQGADYTVSYKNSSGEISREKPTVPDTYQIIIDFSSSSRYCGIISGDSDTALVFTIRKLSLEGVSPAGADSFIYNGTDQMAGITGYITYSGINFYSGIDYYLEYNNSSPVNASDGLYRIVAMTTSKYITGASNYSRLKINPKSIAAADVEFAYSDLTDNGANTALYYNGMALVEGRDYYKTITATASATTLTVTGINNYTGQRVIQQGKSVVNYVTVTQPQTTAKKVVYKKPKATTVSKLTKGKKQFKVTWKKKSGVTGYQVQYSTSKKFTKKATKTITVKGAKSSSKTVKKLKGKKKYYVRVRVYNKYKVNSKSTKTVYSSWSKAKSVTTKK